MAFPFTKPPKFRELGAEAGQSYWAVRRLAISGVAPTVAFPDGERIETEWANRYCRSGLTDQELRQYRETMKRRREKQ